MLLLHQKADWYKQTLSLRLYIYLVASIARKIQKADSWQTRTTKKVNSASFSCFSRPAQWHSEKTPINQWMLGLSLRTHRAVLLLCCWGGIQLGVGVCSNWPVSAVGAVVLTYHTVLATAAKKFSVHKCKLASTFTRPKMQMKMCFLSSSAEVS